MRLVVGNSLSICSYNMSHKSGMNYSRTIHELKANIYAKMIAMLPDIHEKVIKVMAVS